jgi:hypothetical protein
MAGNRCPRHTPAALAGVFQSAGINHGSYPVCEPFCRCTEVQSVDLAWVAAELESGRRGRVMLPDDTQPIDPMFD